MDTENESVEEAVPASIEHHSILELFDELTFRQKVHKFFYGLSQPTDSGDFKWSRLQMVRLSAPLMAILVPVFFMFLLILFAGMQQHETREVQVMIKEPETIENLEDIEDIMDEPIEPPEPIELDFAPNANVTMDSPLPPSPAVDVTSQPAEFDTVAIVKSPVIMKGMFGSRTPGGRGRALSAYGGSGVTEGAVIRALRWLKKNQHKDGSWPKTKPAMTSLALLTFLAHGETPSSEEFGETVEKAIRWLVTNQDAKTGLFTGRDGHNYSHPIVTYALCEAYALTKVPMAKTAAERALKVLIKGQHPSGGWDYNCKQTTRDDTSYMGWCAQALKAAKMAGVKHTQLESAMRLAIKGFQKNAHPNGGFGYTSPGQGGLTGVGVLCMQLLGASKEKEVSKGLEYLKDWPFSWSGAKAKSPVYYWYYITQAKFHAGGATWDRWNNMFATELVRNQQVIKGVIPDVNGKMRDVGFWDSPSEHEHGDGRVMDTCLCALQLQVYYRYLPTFKPPADIEEDLDYAEDDADIEIEIDI